VPSAGFVGRFLPGQRRDRTAVDEAVLAKGAYLGIVLANPSSIRAEMHFMRIKTG
jgi:hypothetical protein